jgi:hypothetical protein
VNPYLAHDALDRMAEGADAPSALAAVLAADEAAGFRQIGLIGAHGPGAAHTGEGCTEVRGDRASTDFAVQGNMLADASVLDAMADAFAAGPGLPLEERLMRALEAGEAAGGDRRGRQSAALLVTGAEAYARVDLRVDEDPAPVARLRRTLTVATAQLAPFVAGMARRGHPAAPPDPALVEMLLRPPPERPTGGGSGPGLGALDPAAITGLDLAPDRLAEVAAAFVEIRAEIERLRRLDLGETAPAVVFAPEPARGRGEGS